MAQFLFQTLTLDAVTAQAIVSRIGLGPARWARLTAGAQPIRYRYDGVSPLTNIGHLLAANAQVDLDGADLLRQLRLIATTATSTCYLTTEGP